MNNIHDVLAILRKVAREEQLASMRRLGINTKSALGVRVTELRRIARSIGKSHLIGQRLWNTGIHEARILATLVEDPARVTSQSMEAWAADIDSWDLCDAACVNLFVSCRPAWSKIRSWSRRRDEYVRRCAFTLIATFAIHDRDRPDRDFLSLLPVIERGADDQRNYVKKAVSWALKQIGKRSPKLARHAIETAMHILDDKGRNNAARWVARDVLRELQKHDPYDSLRLDGEPRKRG